MDVRRILLIRTDRIGDVVLTLPMVDLIKAHWPGAEVTFLVRSYTEPIVRHAPGVDRVLLFDRDGAPRPAPELLRDLRDGKFDVAVHVFPRPGQAWLTFRAGIPVRIGTAFRWFSMLFTHRTRDHRKSALRHEAEFNARLLMPLGVSVPDRLRPRIVPDAQHHDAADRVFQELGLTSHDRPVIVHPGSGGSSRDWSPDRFGSLAKRLSADVPVIVTGAAGERELVAEVVAASDGSAKPCVGRFSLMELAAFLQRGSVVVANSTGPLHIAAAVGTPVVGFFPPVAAMSAKRWGPLSDRGVTFTPDPARCPHCTGDMCAGDLCMSQIEVEDVEEAVRRLMRGPLA